MDRQPEPKVLQNEIERLKQKIVEQQIEIYALKKRVMDLQNEMDKQKPS